MPFDVKALIRKANRGSKRVRPSQKISEPGPVSEPEVKIEYTNPMLEIKQEITIPAYESEDEPEVLHNLPVSRKRVKNQNISRKVVLNPLSDE
jgi:hypothetical protein